MIEAWYANSVIPAITSTDYEGEIKSYGDNINIRSTPSISISNYTVGAPLTYAVPSANLVELSINKAKTWAKQ